jgi:GNAT superfamily N-acetyltransferase
MPDLLVRLYDLPDAAAAVAVAARDGVTVRRANAWERRTVIAWVERTFSPGWAAECEVAFGHVPPRCFVAMRGDAVVAFACHDVTRRNFFGPTGVATEARGRGIGAALALVTLAAMRDEGYAYAIVGGVGPADFYARVAGATPIPGSTPGIYDTSVSGRS